MRHVACTVLLVLLALSVGAQWDVPIRIALTGDSVEQRQVLGLADPLSDDHGVAVSAERARHLTFTRVSGTSLLVGELPLPLPALISGQRITFVPDSLNPGPVTIALDGLPAVPVMKYVNEPLDSADLRPGIPVDAVFDGNAFQVISQFPRTCPAGTVIVSRNACMEATPSAPVNFNVAAQACGQRNGRLCSFVEWTGACIMNSSIVSTIVDYEWVDSAANDYDSAKVIGINANTLLPDCLTGGHRIPSNASHFRCCYDR